MSQYETQVNKLSSRDLVEMMAERGVGLTHTTILPWVQRYVPEFEKRWNQYALPVGGSWRCDETYIKVKGRWTYLYRAVDKQGHTVDFLLSESCACQVLQIRSDLMKALQLGFAVE